MSSLDNLDKMIARARALQGTRDPADDFHDEDAPQASPYDYDEDEEELEDEPQPVPVKQRKPRRDPAKLTVTLDKGAEALTYALRQLTTAINSIAPATAGVKSSDLPPVSVSVSVTVNVDATPLVEKLTDGVRVATGGEREGVLSKALRETLSDLGAPSVSALLKKDASQFVKILGRRLDEVETMALSFSEAVSRPLEFSDEEDDDAPPVEIPQDPPQRVETVKTVDLIPQEEPQRVDVADEFAAYSVEVIKELVRDLPSENRPLVAALLSRYGVGRWEDIPRPSLLDAVNTIIEISEPEYDRRDELLNSPERDDTLEVTDEDATAYLAKIREIVRSLPDEKRPLVGALLLRYKVGRFEDIPRRRLYEATSWVIGIQDADDFTPQELRGF